MRNHFYWSNGLSYPQTADINIFSLHTKLKVECRYRYNPLDRENSDIVYKNTPFQDSRRDSLKVWRTFPQAISSLSSNE